MWETDFAIDHACLGVDQRQSTSSIISWTEIAAGYLHHWEEHCTECALPDCYQICPLYHPRRDERCARFQYGITANPHFRGLYPYGAEVHFRRWGKLESLLQYGYFSPFVLRILDRVNRVLFKVVEAAITVIQPHQVQRRLIHYAILRKRFLRWLSRRSLERLPEAEVFAVEVWNPSSRPVRLILEAFEQEDLRFRTSLLLPPGESLHEIPVTAMQFDLTQGESRIHVYPDQDMEVSLIFNWLDFVRFRKPRPASAVPQPAALVKCVVWDLDNTLWHGTLIEDGLDGIVANPEALQMVRELDARGVLQSIASKNDHAMAWKMVERQGMADYFLYPAIHWGPKSEGIRRIADELNIGVDSIAFIDDSPFELEEVRQALPQVRIYSNWEIPTLFEKPEFDLPVTEESRGRRASYQAETSRKTIAREFGANYDDFLRNCGMTVEVFVPRQDQHLTRCLELLHRSNQLNLTTHRYHPDEFHDLLRNPQALALAISCRDRFGDYGLVGFASLHFGDHTPLLQDFVLSCRVAAKRVENAWFQWLSERLRRTGCDRLQARFIRTERNGVLREALTAVGFGTVSQDHQSELLELATDRDTPAADIVRIEEPETISLRHTVCRMPTAI